MYFATFMGPPDFPEDVFERAAAGQWLREGVCLLFLSAAQQRANLVVLGAENSRRAGKEVCAGGGRPGAPPPRGPGRRGRLVGGGGSGWEPKCPPMTIPTVACNPHRGALHSG